MEITEIGMWLRGSRDYSKGKDLYYKYSKTYGKNLTLSLLLKSNISSSYILSKLSDTLQGFSDQFRKSKEPNPNKVVVTPTWKDIDTSEWPIDLQNKRKKINELYHRIDQKRGVIHNLIYNSNKELRQYFNEEQHHTLCKDIVESHQLLESLWDELNYYKDNGERMTPAPKQNTYIERLFILADENPDIKELLFNHGNLLKYANRLRNKRHLSLKDPAMKEANDSVKQSKLIQQHYEHRY